VFGKEAPTTSTAANDTVVHQVSEMSSRVVVECSFTNFDRKKRKEKLREARKNIQNSNQTNEIGQNLKQLAVLITNQNLNNASNEVSPSNQCEYELQMMFNGSNEAQSDTLAETVENVSTE
jgi:hypothetical protein